MSHQMMEIQILSLCVQAKEKDFFHFLVWCDILHDDLDIFGLKSCFIAITKDDAARKEDLCIY